MELALIPIKDLLAEIDRRTVCFVGAYFLPDDKDNLVFHYGQGWWSDACMLSSLLDKQVSLNWHGELRTLKRINDEEGDN